MADKKSAQPKDAGKKPDTKEQKGAAALSTDDLEKVSGGLNPQPLPPRAPPRSF